MILFISGMGSPPEWYLVLLVLGLDFSPLWSRDCFEGGVGERLAQLLIAFQLILN